MKKIILLLGVLLTFGCTAKIDITIKENEITENFQLNTEEIDTFTKEELYSQYLEEYPIYYDEEFLYYAPTSKLEGVEYYEKNIIETEHGYNATYKSQYEINNYEKSRLLNTAFKNYSIGYNREENCYYIIAQNLKIFNNSSNQLTNIEININIEDYDIVETNAIYRNNNILTWKFSKSESNDLNNIMLKYKKKEINNEISNNVNDNKNDVVNNTNDIIIVILCLIGFSIMIGVVIFFKNIKKIKNKINF